VLQRLHDLVEEAAKSKKTSGHDSVPALLRWVGEDNQRVLQANGSPRNNKKKT
jgi:hypothetical protein